MQCLDVMLLLSWRAVCLCVAVPPELTYAWLFNEYPYFVQQDNRRFVSQRTGNLYIAKVEPSDVGNYTCVVMNSVTKGKVQSSPTSLILRAGGESGERERAWSGRATLTTSQHRSIPPVPHPHVPESFQY